MSPRDGLSRVVTAATSHGIELTEVKDGEWRGRCPIHQGTTKNSLSIQHHVPTNGGGGRARIRCWGGCDEGQVLDLLGLSWDDIYDDTLPAGARDRVREFPYIGPSGQLIGVVQRREPKTFRPLTVNGDGHWQQKSSEDLKTTPYRLPELVAAIDRGDPIWVVEGERDVDTLAAHGITATCNAGGANKWTTAHARWLAGAHVTVCADNDEPGHAHAATVITTLRGVAASIRLVEVVGGCKDISEHLAVGRSLEDVVSVAIPEQDTEPPPPDEKTAEDIVPAPNDPMGVARKLLEDYQRDDVTTLRHWRGAWMHWRDTCWLEDEASAVRAWLYTTLENAMYEVYNPANKKYDLESWKPNRKKIADVVDALAATIHLPESVDPPAWLKSSQIPPGEVVACPNGLLHVRTRKLYPLTPLFFNRVAVPFDWDPGAPKPERWLTFLKQLWPDDPDSVAALQQFFGYVLSGRTDLHKILLLVGPTRSGKGTIARVLAALIGKGNVAGPTLASLGTNFGLAPLLGKPLALVSDARLGTQNVHQVVERLLSISGEDMLTVDRKYRDPWTGKLPARFFILSNELPRFGDASGAIAHRFIVITLKYSWLGNENPKLTEELLQELPGILAWSLDGLDELTKHGSFTEPASSGDAILALQDLVSPVAAFVRDECTIGAGLEVLVSELYGRWKTWCEDNGRDKPGTVQTFGRDLRAVVPTLRVHRPRDGDVRLPRRYLGLKLSQTHNGCDRGPTRSEEQSEESSGPQDRVGPQSNPLWVPLDAQRSSTERDHDSDGPQVAPTMAATAVQRGPVAHTAQQTATGAQASTKNPPECCNGGELQDRCQFCPRSPTYWRSAS